MAEYYAVERSPEYLAHYGVKGMKWGVRKAIERLGLRPKSAAYRSAKKKLSGMASGIAYTAKHRKELGAVGGFRYGKDKKRAFAVGIGSGARVVERIGKNPDSFEKEMDKYRKKADTFKANRRSAMQKSKSKKSLAQRFKNRKYFTNNDFKQAFKAAGLGMVMGPAGANAYLTSKKIANEIPANNNRHGKKRRR